MRCGGGGGVIANLEGDHRGADSRHPPGSSSTVCWKAGAAIIAVQYLDAVRVVLEAWELQVERLERGDIAERGSVPRAHCFAGHHQSDTGRVGDDRGSRDAAR